MARIEELQSILDDPEKCKQVIKDEMQAIIDKYGDERKTEIVYASEEFNPEDFYADEPMIITMSHLGYIKRTALTEYRLQGRGGVGSRGSDKRDEDFIEHTIYPRAARHQRAVPSRTCSTLSRAMP